ncbi:MAG: hypothetical protein JSU06_14965 [Actinobacteria bacterium]|nr:hypothetical protein [Actinomycetota bacterium]
MFLLAVPGTARGAGAQVPPRAIKGALTRIPQVHLVWVPSGTSVAALAGAGFSPGLMSVGLGTVSADQAYLDIGAGNRTFDSLYGHEIGPAPAAASACRPWFAEAVARAETAPDEIEPGLLVKRLEAGHVGTIGEGASACPLGIVPSKAGIFGGLGGAGLFLASDASLAVAAQLARRAGPHDLVIAVATPPAESEAPLPIGVAGKGYAGNLTSDTTRTNGYVSSTDIAPTTLEFFGLPVPSQMIGQAIRAEGPVDAAGVEARGARMAVVSVRRGPVIGFSLLAWVLALGLVVLLSRGALAPVGVRLIGLSVIYLPVLLLVGSALEEAEYPEMLVVMVGSPLLGALTLAALRGYRPLAVAAGVTVGAYALDAILGSPLSALSLLGPNPELGVRFYGIGNELEALLVVATVGGIGAGLAGFAPRLSPRRCAAVFLAIALVCAGIFASGAFGADVGAAVDIPIGAVVAALVVSGRRRRWILAVILVPLGILALLALADLVTGANSHFTRSILDAGGVHSLADTARRRLEQTARSFVRPVLLVALPVIALGVVVACLRRDTIDGWVRDTPAMRAGLVGAAVGTIAGTLANDSGALLLEIGAAYLLVFLGWAWAEGGRSARGA